MVTLVSSCYELFYGSWGDLGTVVLAARLSAKFYNPNTCYSRRCCRDFASVFPIDGCRGDNNSCLENEVSRYGGKTCCSSGCMVFIHYISNGFSLGQRNVGHLVGMDGCPTSFNVISIFFIIECRGSSLSD